MLLSGVPLIGGPLREERSQVCWGALHAHQLREQLRSAPGFGPLWAWVEKQLTAPPPEVVGFAGRGPCPQTPTQPSGAQPSRVTVGAALAAGTEGWGSDPSKNLYCGLE